MIAPIVLCVYNRLTHTQRTLEALMKNEGAADSELFVYSDGPRTEKDEEKIASVRRYLRALTGFKRVRIIERMENLGCARSTIGAVTEVVGEYGRVIVLDDDLVTSRFFLRYMNQALDLYAHEEQVISISGYMLPVGSPLPSSFFLEGADVWGWATWGRGWALFDPDGRKLLQGLSDRGWCRRLDLDGAYPYTRMLKRQIAGVVDSWAVRWLASAVLHEKLTLYPSASLVQNIGLDGTGLHSRKAPEYDVELADAPVALEKLAPIENPMAADALRRYHRRTRRSMRGVMRRAYGYLDRRLKAVRR